MIKCYLKILENCKGDDHAKLADSYYMIDELDLSIKHWKIATQMKPTEFIYFYNLGQVIQTQHIDLPAAERAYEKSLTLNATYEESYYNLGIVQMDMGKAE